MRFNRIGRKTHPEIQVKLVDRLDQPDAADLKQILRIIAPACEPFDYMPLSAETELSIEDIVMALDANVEVESIYKSVYQSDGNEISFSPSC